MGNTEPNAAQGPGQISRFLRWVVLVPQRPLTYKRICYLVAAFPLGLLYFITLTVGIAIGLSLLILLVGIPILLLVFGGTLLAAQFERVWTGLLLEIDIESTRSVPGESRLDKTKALLRSRTTYTPFVYLLSLFIIGLSSFVFLTSALSTAIAMLLVPLYYDQPGLYVGIVTDRAPEFHQTIYLAWNQLLVGFETVITVGYWEISTLWQALIVAAGGIFLLLTTIHILNALGWIVSKWAVWALDGGYDITALRSGET